MTPVYIGLGSNLDSPEDQLRSACDQLQRVEAIPDLSVSPFYRSKPHGPQDQPDFINAAAKFSTQLTPLALLDLLQEIERNHHRKRLVHWGPRSLDLDIIFYGKKTIDLPRLNIPHKELKNRAFVIKPILDLTPDLIMPNGKALKTLYDALPKEELANLEQLKSANSCI